MNIKKRKKRPNILAIMLLAQGIKQNKKSEVRENSGLQSRR